MENKTQNNDNSIDTIDNRQVVLDSLMFLAAQRSKSLMKLSLLRKNKKLVENEEYRTLKEARRIKDRMLKEIDINRKYLNKTDERELGLDKGEEV